VRTDAEIRATVVQTITIDVVDVCAIGGVKEKAVEIERIRLPRLTAYRSRLTALATGIPPAALVEREPLELHDALSVFGVYESKFALCEGDAHTF
jgi:hypothetical protein